MIKPFHHPSADQLITIAEGRILPNDWEAVSVHIAACPRCTTEIARLERLIGLMSTDNSEDAPVHVIARAVRLLAQRAVTPLPGFRRRLLATLQFDSAQRPLVLGVRGAWSPPRQLLFSDGDHMFDVRITPSDTDWTVAGQVLGSGSSESGRVELRGSSGIFQTVLNVLGEFTLLVPSGTYVLLVALSDVEVEIPELTIGN